MSKEYKQQPRGDYEVGFAKPPAKSTFAKGHPYYAPYSRRSKEDLKAKAGGTILSDVVNGKTPARIDGRRRSITRLKAFGFENMQAALQCDWDALVRLARRAKKLGYFDMPPNNLADGVIVIYRDRSADKKQASPPITTGEGG